ncbi:hypothetical protein RRF57_005133 [Xylaria bambusicola]|uniref:Uncharacterized protein n=1 Tax=Xylaria bambusicola TaxID=326684 RepID=A0AAN7ULE8_9PEZI
MAPTHNTKTLTISIGQSGLRLEENERIVKRGLLLGFLKGSEACVGGNNFYQPGGDDSIDTSTVVSPAEVVMELRLVPAPAEIFLNIVRYLNKPYTLRGHKNIWQSWDIWDPWSIYFPNPR